MVAPAPAASAEPTTAPILAASSSSPPPDIVTSSTDRAVGPLSTAPLADGWLMAGRVVPAGGLLLGGLTARDSSTSASTSTLAPAVSTQPATPAPTVTLDEHAGGGRRATASRASGPSGWGFGSSIGRFSISRDGVLLGGSNDGSASVRLAVPASIAGLAALVGALAVLGQRRAERRRRGRVELS